MQRHCISKFVLQVARLGFQNQQQQRALFATAAVVCSMAGKSVLHRISPEQPKDKSWLEQKLHEENKTSAANPRKAGANAGAKSAVGFVKIDKSSGGGKDHQPPDGSGDAAVTLTPKALQAKDRWQQTSAAKERLHQRLKDSSLAGWQRRKIELKLKHGGDQWDPTKKIAASSMEKIRLLNAEFPEVWTMQRLSEQFKVSQETIRRILKSKFRPSDEHIEKREQKRKDQLSAFKQETRMAERDGGFKRSEASGTPRTFERSVRSEENRTPRKFERSVRSEANGTSRKFERTERPKTYRTPRTFERRPETHRTPRTFERTRGSKRSDER
ncbi:hypothetical protein LPJ66_005924 [Kickxella alabastrina]|uniref:Uncharacterized protein n=1 Tax=Kickxella alabastrina TaxID=61397 RepID=A0ACC1ID73_9FUNG|nr:hypothetical protein LPJ66_005924 [Kickxella alabastrina]